MSKFFKVRTRSVINTDLLVKAESEAEAKAKAAAAMYTFLEDDMLFDDDMELTEEEIRDVMIPDCEEYDDEENPDSLDPYEDGFFDDGEDYGNEDDIASNKAIGVGVHSGDYEPPEYFSD